MYSFKSRCNLISIVAKFFMLKRFFLLSFQYGVHIWLKWKRITNESNTDEEMNVSAAQKN